MNAPNDRSGGALLLDLATAFALITALVYATGWTYAYHYFSHFELGLLMLEIPNQYFFMYGFWVFKAWWWVILLPVLATLVLTIMFELRMTPWLQNLKAQRPLLLKQLQVLVVLLTFVLAWWLASVQAADYYYERQTKGFPNYPHVRVWPKTDIAADSRLRKFYAALPEGGYRLLLQNKNNLFLFKLPRDGQPARLAVNQLAMSEVKALRVLP